ncbi:ABC transporter permease [Candidatus Saccharibacteria bacterium]|nr:ABC transporter permease [Candidatus Saccharibacteria bacterium]
MESFLNKYRYSLILLRELVITEFKLRYQGSILGYLWSVMRPLFLFMIMYVVFVYFLQIGGDVPFWPVQLLLGIVLWNFFSEVTNNGVGSIVGRGDVIRKINFPKYVIVVASSISAFINLLINLVVIFIFMAVSGVELQWQILLAPLFILELFVFALGLALLLSALFVRIRDVNYIWEIIMQGLFYSSVVIYPITLVLAKGEFFGQLLLLNPVAQAIQDARYALISSDAITLVKLSGERWYLILIPISIVIITAIVGAYVFKKRSPTFAEDV